MCPNFGKGGQQLNDLTLLQSVLALNDRLTSHESARTCPSDDQIGSVWPLDLALTGSKMAG